MGYVVTNTLFKKRQCHLVTYESGGNKTAVDMILIENIKRIMNTKVTLQEECVHGHHLVVMDMQKQEIRKEYFEKLQERDIGIEDSLRVEEQWDKVEKAMTS